MSRLRAMKAFDNRPVRMSILSDRASHIKLVPRTILLASALLAFAPELCAQSPPKREFRGVWISTVANIDWPPSPGGSVQAQKDSLSALLDRLHWAGFNAVIFQIRPECDAMYQSSSEPWSYYLTGSQGVAPTPFFDPLQCVIDMAHKRGMELHAWFNPYRAVRVVGLYPLSPSHVSVVHPEWILTIGTLKMLDPGLPEVRSYVTGVILDVARRYDIDGIHMDDYFYAAGVNHQDDSSYALDSRGIALKTDWRRDNVNILLRAISDSVKALKPWVKFGVSPAGIYRDGIPFSTSGQDNYSVIYCDPIAWLDGQYVDYLAPQLYWRFGGGQDFALLEPWWRDSVAAHGRAYYPGLATYRIGDPNFGDASEIAQQIRFNRANAGAQGTIQFTANSITSSGNITDTLRSALFRYPALVPSMGWKNTTPPYPPRAIRYAPVPGGGPLALQWDLPLLGPHGDSAYRYVVYRFDHRPSSSELANSQAILSVEGVRSFIPPVPPSRGGPYYYAVTALSRNFVEGDTSNILILSPPPVPLPVAPLAGTVDVPESLSVIWGSSARASAYQFQLGADSGLASGTIVNLPAIEDTSRLLRGFRGQTHYFWRVRACGGGGTSAWSQTYGFRTGFPNAPAPLYPPNIQADLPVLLPLRWNASPSLKLVTYRIQIACSADFSSPLADTTGVSDTSIGSPALEYRTVYFWRVQASNSLGSSPWSGVYRFRTVPVAPIVEEGPFAPMIRPQQESWASLFKPARTFSYEISARGAPTRAGCDTLAQEVEALTEEHQSAAHRSIPWNTLFRASGVYFLHMRARTFSSIRRKRPLQ